MFQKDFLHDFQRKILLMLWTLLIHVSGNKYKVLIFTQVYLCMSSFVNGKGSKLTSYMPKKCQVMESQFNKLFSEPLQPQLEDFLVEKFDNVKNMNEAEFMQFLMNQRFGESYDDLTR